MSEKVSAGEVRAAVQHIEKEGRLPPGLAQAIYEHTTGWRPEQSALPPHRRAPQQSKEDEILDVGLRLQQKASEFAGNKPLTIDAYLRGDKATAASLENGFDQKAIDDVFAVLKRNEKYGGEPITPEIIAQMKDVMGEPSQDLEKYAKAKPPTPVLPQGVEQEAQGVAQIAEQPSAQGQVLGEVLSAKGKTRVYRLSDGSEQVREGGTRAWRNNNEGNIEYGDFAKRHGAIGSDGRFAIFPTEEAGRKAKAALIFGGRNYRDKTLQAAIARYAPPSENNTNNYYNYVLQKVGSNKVMADYSAQEQAIILDAMRDVEGWKAGKINGSQATSSRHYQGASGYRPEVAQTIGVRHEIGSRQFLGGGEPQGQPAIDRQPIYADTSQASSNDRQSEALSYASGTVSDIHRVDWTALAKDVFNTKRSSYVPKYVSQAVKGAIRSV